MRKKIVGFFIFLAKAMSFVLAFCYLAAVVFYFLKDFFPKNVAENIVYLLVGESILPIDRVIANSAGFDGPIFGVLLCCIAAFVIITSVLLIFNLSKLKDGKRTQKKHIIISMVGLTAFISFFGISFALMLIHRVKIILCYLPLRVDFVTAISQKLGTDIVITKAVCAPVIIVANSLLGIIAALLAIRRKKKEKTYIPDGSIIFYTGEYEELIKQEDKKVERIVAKEKSANMPEQSESARELVAKIMKLNQMKESGELTPKEYTRLRQKAIRKYK